jgi:hypothetical protein
MAQIELANSDLIALIDDDDVERVSRRNWYLTNSGYPLSYSKGTTTLLHQFIIGRAPEGMFSDHINRNKLDNRKSNLRFVTPLQSSANTGARKSNKLGIKGVHMLHGNYVAEMRSQGKKFWLGTHPTVEAASAAYQAKALELFGEYARVN